jgi:hypothetical protein
MKRILGLMLAMAALAGCEQEPIFAGDFVGGRYYLTSGLATGGSGRTICYERKRGACDIRVPHNVVKIGADDAFIAAEVARPTDPEIKDYYLIVRLFDAPRADGARCLKAERKAAAEAKAPLTCAKLKTLPKDKGFESTCAVRGPFTRREFDALRRCHCVPIAPGSSDLRCIPDADTPV